MKSCTLTFSGSPAGRHSRPPFLYWPTSFLFLGVDADHRVAGGQVLLRLLVEVGEL
jgi:hypothetical protein